MWWVCVVCVIMWVHVYMLCVGVGFDVITELRRWSAYGMTILVIPRKNLNASGHTCMCVVYVCYVCGVCALCV